MPIERTLPYADQIVDPSALDFFQRIDAEVHAHPAEDASDQALLRYLALRAVGLHTVGFSDREQVPWSMNPATMAQWATSNSLDSDCKAQIQTWSAEVATLDRQACKRRFQAERQALQALEAQRPRWQAFYAILMGATSAFGIGSTFDLERFISPRRRNGRYIWNADEQYGKSFQGRSFVNPVAAAEWLRDHQPGFEGAIMHASGLQCPDGGAYVSINEQGTARWAQQVLAKIEQAELRLAVATERPVLDERIRPRI